MPEKTEGKSKGTPVASNYIIEVYDGKKRAFVICVPTLIIADGEGWGGLTADEIASYIAKNNLHAAPLPGRPLAAAEFRAGPGHR